MSSLSFFFPSYTYRHVSQALRMSLEEERARQAAASSSTSAAPVLETIPESAPITATPDNRIRSQAPPPAERIDEDDEEAMLQRALALSRGEDVDMADAEAADEDEDMTEEEAIAKAIAMSIQEDKEGGGEEQGKQ